MTICRNQLSQWSCWSLYSGVKYILWMRKSGLAINVNNKEGERVQCSLNNDSISSSRYFEYYSSFNGHSDYVLRIQPNICSSWKCVWLWYSHLESRMRQWLLRTLSNVETRLWMTLIFYNHAKTIFYDEGIEWVSRSKILVSFHRFIQGIYLKAPETKYSSPFEQLENW